MLAKRNRLNRPAFNQAFRSGRRFSSPEIDLIVAPSTTFHGAVVVGKKVYKRAVARNQLRRQLYGVLYRAHRAQALPTSTCIVIAKPKIVSLTRQERQTLLTSLYEKAIKSAT